MSKTLSFRASDNFERKYNEILKLEKTRDYPLSKSEIFDEMIDLYYAKKFLGESAELLGEELESMIQGNLAIFGERLAVMVNSIHEDIDKITDSHKNND